MCYQQEAQREKATEGFMERHPGRFGWKDPSPAAGLVKRSILLLLRRSGMSVWWNDDDPMQPYRLGLN